MKKLFMITFALLISMAGFSQDITGIWNGILNAQGTQLKLVFHIEKTGNTYKGTFDSPDQGAKDIPITTTTFDGANLKLIFSNINASYEGVLSEKSITGIWKQGISSFPLILSKEDVEKEEVKRPQELVKPYPYYEENVIIENKQDSLKLAGTLTLPNKNEKFPVVILISGSGPQNRNGELFGHKPFLVLANHLTRQGIAVLRFDDRGFGNSTGNHSDATTYDFSTDVISAINYLKSRMEINKNQIGLVGHSEGGIIAPLVANRSKDVAFIVSLAGTGISGTELSIIQSKALRPFPVPDEEIYEQSIRRAIEIASQDKEISEVQKELREHYDKTIVPILINLGVSDVQIDNMMGAMVKMRTTKWIRYFYQYNPAEEYQKVSCPVLSLNGSKDKQVDAKINQDGLREALIKGKNKDYSVLELPNLNHLFQECKTGDPSEYSQIEQTFSPIALQEISNWILKRVKK